MIDIDALAAQASSTEGDNIVVSRRWLAAVEREIRAGRAAMAQVRAASCMDQAIRSIVDGGQG